MSRDAKEAEVLQGTLDMVILQAAALGAIHGYGLVQRIQRISNEALQIRQGSLYPALHRLESRGWLKADWRTSGTGREAKYYALTKAGQRQLKTEKESWARLCAAISSVLQAAG